jgi:malic enzyme
MEQPELAPRVAAAVAMKALEEGLARISKTREEIYNDAMRMIKETRRALDVLMHEGVIRTAI